MRLIVAFAVGALLGGMVTAILVRSPPPDGPRDEAFWQERAETAEHELANARRQLDTLAGELQRLADRFQELTGRFEALQAAAPPTPQAE